MTTIVIFSAAVFATACCLGVLFHRSSIWNIVDLFYYPLSAIGVVLLFVNNATQRQLLELNQLAEKYKNELHVLLSAKPSVRALANGELVDSSFRLIATISELGEACKGLPKVDPQCMVAESLEPSVATFLEAAQAQYASPELKLSSACSAAEHLLDDIRAKDQMSALVGDELIAQYKTAVAKSYGPMDYDGVTAESQAFERRALGQIESLRKLVQSESSESTGLVLAMWRSEANFGKIILQGLYPCIVAPKKDLDLLAKWTTSRQDKEEDIKRVERDRQRMKESSPGNPLSLWISLNLWPFVIISALSLKFAKSVAAARKSNSSSDKRSTRELNEPDAMAQESTSSQAIPEGEAPKDAAAQASSESSILGDELSRDDTDSTLGKPPAARG